MIDINTQQHELISDCSKKWSIDEMVRRAPEELLELALSILHWNRGKASIDDIKSEMADVRITLEHLERRFGSYQEHFNSKMKRLAEREDGRCNQTKTYNNEVSCSKAV